MLLVVLFPLQYSTPQNYYFGVLLELHGNNSLHGQLSPHGQSNCPIMDKTIPLRANIPITEKFSHHGWGSTFCLVSELGASVLNLYHEDRI